MNETLKTLNERRSIRAYRAEMVSEEQLNQILQAGLMAPSAKGQQSPVLVAVQDPETVALMSRLNAQVMGTESDPFYGAGTVVVVLADPKATSAVNAVCDGALVMGNLMNAAARNFKMSGRAPASVRESFQHHWVPPPSSLFFRPEEICHIYIPVCCHSWN